MNLLLMAFALLSQTLLTERAWAQVRIEGSGCINPAQTLANTESCRERDARLERERLRADFDANALRWINNLRAELGLPARGPVSGTIRIPSTGAFFAPTGDIPGVGSSWIDQNGLIWVGTGNLHRRHTWESAQEFCHGLHAELPTEAQYQSLLNDTGASDDEARFYMQEILSVDLSQGPSHLLSQSAGDQAEMLWTRDRYRTRAKIFQIYAQNFFLSNDTTSPTHTWSYTERLMGTGFETRTHVVTWTRNIGVRCVIQPR